MRPRGLAHLTALFNTSMIDAQEEGQAGGIVPGKQFSYTVSHALTGLRLDQFLAVTAPATSRSLFAEAIGKGLVAVDGVVRKSSYRVKAGEVMEGCIEPPPSLDVVPQAIEFAVIYEDEHLLALSKPPGLVVHPGSGNRDRTLANGLVHHCLSIASVGEASRPGIVHRLDKDTSGVMLVAKQEVVHRRLVEAFKTRSLIKEYQALVHGRMRDTSGRVVAAIGRHPQHRQKMAVLTTGGRHAVSNWQVLREFSLPLSLLKVTIETGRTHQIRVHMAHLGHPLAGDQLYGGSRPGLYPRQLLHAARLVFEHPMSGREMEVSAPLWPDFAEVLSRLESAPA
jgi:23S rRNA pseudouridine1911/1915/1917 synthase